jgi:glycosyltransferase involved in cell wall biosynthesis
VSQNFLPPVSVVIPAYNEELYIEQTLQSILHSDYPEKSLEIIVVDNGSQDNTIKIAKNYCKKVLSLDEGNVGAVRNYGVKNSESDIIIFLDADCLVDKKWIQRGVNLLLKNKDTAFGGPYKTRENANWVERLWLLENPKYPRVQPDLLGGCIFIYRDQFYSVNGFDEKMTAGEDSDLSDKLRNKNFKVKIESSISVVHLGNPKSLKEFFKRQVWHSENYIRFLKNSVRDYTFWIVFLFIISITVSIIGIFTLSPIVVIYGLFSALILTCILSLKRMILTKYLPKNAKDILGIMTLDLAYLSARACGTIKPLLSKIF